MTQPQDQTLLAERPSCYHQNAERFLHERTSSRLQTRGVRWSAVFSRWTRRAEKSSAGSVSDRFRIGHPV